MSIQINQLEGLSVPRLQVRMFIEHVRRRITKGNLVEPA